MGTQHLTSATNFCELLHESEGCQDEILGILQSLDDNNSSNIFNLSAAYAPGPVMKNRNRTSNEKKKRKKHAKSSSSSSSLKLCSYEESEEDHAMLSQRKSVQRQNGSLSPPATSFENRSGDDGGGVGESNNNGKVVSHIAVERNRRKQMIEHLAVLRQLVPCFYVKKGDKASVVGGVIDYINELHDHVHQSLEAKNRRNIYTSEVGPTPRVS